jgi:excisionase family DNA binding protein
MSAQTWLTVTEAAEHLRCSPKTIYRLVQQRRLRAAQIGGKRALRFRVEWLDEYAYSVATVVEIGR